MFGMRGPSNAGKFRLRAAQGLRIAVTAMFAWTTIVHPVFAQTPAPTGQPDVAAPAAQPPAFAMGDLEYLLGPIALYPDPLIALILPASTFPLQVLKADRWISRNQQAVEKGDFSQIDAMQWDPSVQALARFPDVIKTMADHLDWLESLGDAYYFQPRDVAAAIQLLRAKAVDVGNLKSTSQQVVTSRDDGGARIVYIAPANPERIYIPVYDPGVVFAGAVTGAIVFSTGVLVGSAWNSRWGWNNRTWNQIWIAPPAWQGPGRPVGPPPGSWRPDRPGPRPDRPGTRPDRPGTRPDRPAVRPDRPVAKPDRPARPDRPAARPDRPAARPDRPATPPRPDRPAARPSRPSAPAARPGGTRPSAPAARPGGSRPANIQRPPAARPQQRARPQPSARPSKQRARPAQGARPAQQRARPQGTGSRRN
jgi:hypothetical protein